MPTCCWPPATCGVERIFFSSSACVYNVALQQSSAPRPLREQDAYPAMPEDGYGWEKLFSERLYHHFQEEFGLEVRIARYHNAYGPHGTWEGGREKAPAAICRKVIEAVCSGREEIEIWGDGKQSRSFMYVDDAIEGTLRLMRSEVSEPLNIGSAELVTIDQLVDVAEEIAGVKLRRRYVLSEPQGGARAQQRQQPYPRPARLGTGHPPARGAGEDLPVDP
ncbi:MAG: hypothetical protein KatS3mg102_2665 [Planctomycetota bacterium]|nr:MAG: hypothetical protein KatS3mg102_2665 [Planctomycetota bacterium]